MSKNNSEEKDEYLVPGRISLDQLHQEQKELREAQEASKLVPKSKKVINAMSMFSAATDFGIIIALPLIILIYLGKWLDNRFHTKYYVLLGLMLAIGISSMGIYKQIKKLKEQLKK